MNTWTIRVLLFGYLTGYKGDFDGGLDPDLLIQLPYAGFLLQNGRENILVDTGVHADFLSKLHLSDVAPIGGAIFVRNELKSADLEVEDIDAVIYTHLHNDHAGNADLFPHARTYIQRLEYENLLHPWPEHNVRLDYDTAAIDRLKKVQDIRWLDGDTTLECGLELYLTPGHTAGSQSIVVPTAKGRYVIGGDTPHLTCALFPWMETMWTLEGKEIPISYDKCADPLPNSFGYDKEAVRASYQKMAKLGERFEQEFYLFGHDPVCVLTKYYG